MKILVTGGLGFIGSSLTEELLKQGHEVCSIDNLDPYYDPNIKLKNLESLKKFPKFKSFIFDLIEKEKLEMFFKEEQPEVVFHAAAKAGVRPSLADPLSYVQANLSVLTNLLEVMRLNSVKKMVFCSSSSVYGRRDATPAQEEESFDNAISFYATTKQCGELINRMYHNLYHFSFLNLRFFTVYGPRQRPDLAIFKFLDAAINKKPITLYGDGSMKRDYTYIDDIVQGCIKSIDFVCEQKSPVFETLNLGSSSPVDLIELISVIEKVSGEKLEVHKQDVPPGDVPVTFASVKKAKVLLNWTPKMNLEEGVSKFYSVLKV